MDDAIALAATIQDDTLNVLLANAMNRNESDEYRAKAIRKCAKAVCQRTPDKVLKHTCKIIRNEKRTSVIIEFIETAEVKYYINYGYPDAD